jgi:hypothetical protein
MKAATEFSYSESIPKVAREYANYDAHHNSRQNGLREI